MSEKYEYISVYDNQTFPPRPFSDAQRKESQRKQTQTMILEIMDCARTIERKER